MELSPLRCLPEFVGSGAADSLSIGTTHTQARYVLPTVIRSYREKHHDVQLNLHQGTVEQIADMLVNGQVDLAIATGSPQLFPDTTILPVYHWYRSLIVPIGHPLASECRPSLRSLAAHPIITYAFSFEGPSSLNATFATAGLAPKVVLTACDADVIKTYVRLGLGVGIVARMAIDPNEDDDLVAIDAQSLFPRHTTWVGIRHGRYLRRHVYDFLQYFAPHLDRRRVERARAQAADTDIERMFGDVRLPVR